MPKIALVAVIRNQAPYLLEWMIHHLAVGADHFVLCVHGSSDGTAKVTRRLAGMGYAAHVKISVQNDDPVGSALAQIEELSEIKEADWIGLLNVDQFANSHVGHGSLAELLADADEAADAIDIPVFSFGATLEPDAITGKTTALCTERFADAGDQSVRFARSLGALKAPENLQAISPRAVQINQYFCKSEDHLAVLLSTPLYQAEAEILDQWEALNGSGQTDTTLRRYDHWHAKYARFLRADRRLRLGQQAGIDWHKARAILGRETDAFKQYQARNKRDAP